MSEGQQFNQSQSNTSIEVLHQNRIEVSILKHISAARKILDGENKTYEIYSPRCLYQEILQKTNKYIIPKIDQSTKLIGNRLISIQDVIYQYGRMKEKIKDGNNKHQKQNIHNTLWDVYGEREIYYSRFEPKMKKNNFANLFMNIAGINLENKLKINNFPQIKNKNITQQCKNNGSLIFDSHFQSGNLLYVYKNHDDKNTIQTYDLILQNDINTRGHNQWFYFKITNTKKNQKIRLNLINLIKKQSLFSYGLKPLTFSQKNNKNNITWIRNGQKITYQQSFLKRQNKNELYYTLSFEYQFRQAYDTVYFSPSYPYTYSQLLYFMDNLLTQKKYNNYLTIKKLCESIGKNTINLITISTGKQIVKQSKIIWILARQHPVQTTSSYMVQGIIIYLLNLMLKSNQNGNTFYDNYIFKIIPMINPDGVIHGNTRAQITGIDTNRIWKKPLKNINPTVYYIKKQIEKTKDETCMILDLHSHSKKLGCFFYGNYNQNDIKSYRILPSNVCNNDIRFCYKNCRFRGGNQNSARRSLFLQLGIPNIFTVQCSLLGYIKDNRINQYKISDYHQMGIKIIQTFFTLQKQTIKNKGIIKEYPHENNDCCDAQSARSDSCISDQEYQQVYQQRKIKKKIHDNNTKYNKPRSNTFVYNHKHQLSDINHKKIIQNSTAKIIQSKQNQEDKYITLLPTEQGIKLEQKRQFSIKIRSNKLTQKNIRNLTIKKRINPSIKQQISEDSREMKTYGQKSTQVQQLKVSNDNIDTMLKMKTQKKLIIVGNSVQEQKIFIGKNEVGIQIDNSSKQNIIVGEGQGLMQRRTISNKMNVKLNRRITDINENIRLDRSFKVEKKQKGVLMFRN